MSRYISVLGLAARSCFLKGLAIMVVSVLLSGLLLYLLPEGVERESYMDENGVVQWIYEAYDLSEIPEVSRAAAPLAVGFGLLCTVMARTGGGKGAKTAYTVGRLRVKPGTVRRLWTGYYFMMLVLYWAMAAAMLYGVMRYRVGLAAESMDIGPQSLVLAFYGSNLLHHILPISDFFRMDRGRCGPFGLRRGVHGCSSEGMDGAGRRTPYGHCRGADPGKLLGADGKQPDPGGHCHWGDGGHMGRTDKLVRR